MRFEERVFLNELKLNDTDDQIIEYIRNNLEKVISQSIQKTAQELYTVPNSIMRLSKKLNYNGFSEMKFALKEEIKIKEHEEVINSKKEDKKIKEVNKNINSESIDISNLISENILRTINLIDNKAVEKVVKKINESKSVKFLGIGDSIYFCEMFSKNIKCTGKNSEFFHHRHDMMYSVENCDSRDLYIVISVSGESLQIIEEVEKAKARGAYIISMTHFSDNSLAKLADLKLFYWAPKERKNNYNSTDRIGIMIIIRKISELFWKSCV